MTDWTALNTIFLRLRDDAGNDSAALRHTWQDFCAAARAIAARPPTHYGLLLGYIEKALARAGSAITVLDHGCGTGQSALFLTALGYRVFGVDVSPPCSRLNRILAEAAGVEETRFFQYDGRRIPLPDAAIDIVYSQQVIEHIEDACLDLFYEEEWRVLRSGGMAAHWVPHRLIPFDSHTRTWLIHYLPDALYRQMAIILGHPVPDHLHLRWPSEHYTRLTKVFGNFDDLTANRLRLPVDYVRYDGPAKLRRLLQLVVGLPIIGGVSANLLARFLMLETVSRKIV